MAVSRKRKKRRRRGGGKSGGRGGGGALSGLRGGFKGIAHGVVGAGAPRDGKKKGGPLGWLVTAALLAALAGVIYYRFLR